MSGPEIKKKLPVIMIFQHARLENMVPEQNKERVRNIRKILKTNMHEGCVKVCIYVLYILIYVFVIEGDRGRARRRSQSFRC